MKKKLLITMLIASLVTGTLFAGDFSFKFGHLAQRPGYLGGIVPTYLNVGVGYDGISLIEGNKTEFQFYQGLGFTQRNLLQSKTDGSPIAAGTTSTIANLFSTDSTLNFHQGFLEDDCLTANIGIKGAYEMVYDDSVIPNSTVYPDLTEKSNLYNWLIGSVKYDKMVDNIFTQDGYSGELEFAYAPSFTNSTSDFYSAILELQFAKTLYTLESARDGRNILSLVLVDRFATSYTNGSSVPTSYQSKVALGYKVRGFSAYSYNTNFNVVNNLDLRVSTFEITDYPPFLYLPRFNFFLDTGFAAGNFLNSNVSIDAADGFLMSTGLQATVDISDMVDLGYQLAYLINGENLTKESGTSLVGSITFFLMF